MPEERRLSSEELDALLAAGDAAGAPSPTDPVHAASDDAVPARWRWLRRHRVLVSFAVLVLAVGTAGTAATLASRPPPPASTVAATVSLRPAPDLEHGSLRLVIDPDPGTTVPVRAVALVGGGLRPLSLAQDGDDVAVTAQPDCTGLGPDQPPPALALRLAQTDPWGREVIADVPATGAPAADLRSQVLEHCATAAAAAVTVTAVTPRDGHGHGAHLAVTLRNPGVWAYEVHGAGLASDAQSAQVRFLLTSDDEPVTLAPGATTELELVDQFPNCLVRPGSASTLLVWLGSQLQQQFSSRQVSASLTDRFPAAAAAVADPCPQAPVLRYRLTRASADVDRQGQLTASLSRVITAERGEVRRPDTRGADRFVPGELTLVGAYNTTEVRQLRRLRWTVGSCSDAQFFGPPSTWATVRVAGEDYRYLLPLDDARLWDAIVRSCGPSNDPVQSRRAGWPAA